MSHKVQSRFGGFARAEVQALWMRGYPYGHGEIVQPPNLGLRFRVHASTGMVPTERTAFKGSGP